MMYGTVLYPVNLFIIAAPASDGSRVFFRPVVTFFWQCFVRVFERDLKSVNSGSVSNRVIYFAVQAV